MTVSMTGFGHASGTVDGEQTSIEVSSVNHRYLECLFRMPSSWAGVEAALRERVKQKVVRGKLTVSIRREKNGATRVPIHFDVSVASQYLEHSRTLARMMNTTEAVSLNVVMGLEGVFYQEEVEQDLAVIERDLTVLLDAALNGLNESRLREGAALREDLLQRIAAMAGCLGTVEQRLPEIQQAYETRIRERLRELNAEVGLTQDRVALEVAMLAEKIDVNEEIVRLKSHFDHARHLFGSGTAYGRDLNFLSQELQREVNTLGSKIRDVEITREVLTMKAELEKLREQAQNIE
ncbi:MAG: YicC family protein [Candidatus Hydrogenedentes bacterium]|nr:YicC family protein [Candidatus Hydrogenedentota bacterium]